MKLRRRLPNLLNLLALLLLAVAVMYSLRFWPQQLPLLPGDNDNVISREPDYQITNFHAVDLDETGRLRYELTAAQLVHYPQPERAELTDPEMVFYRNNHDDPQGKNDSDSEPGKPAPAAIDPAADPWQLTAARGRIAEGGDRLDLEGDVRVTRLGTAENQPQMQMETARLTVFGKQEIATTDSPVFLSGDRAELHGVGMQIDLKKGQMHLLSRVRGYYVPR